MKKYIRAYKLFLGEFPCKQALYSLVIVAILGAMFCLEDILGSGSDFVMGLFHGIAAMIGPIAPLWDISLLIALYNTCSPETPGYKFFRCIPDGRMQFSRAIVTGNTFVAITSIALLFLAYMLFRLADYNISGVLLGILIMPIAAGFVNFAVYIKRNTARMVLMILLLTIPGFTSGFMVGLSEDGGPTLADMVANNCLPFFIILAAGLVFFAVSVIMAVKYARKKWGVDKCAD